MMDITTTLRKSVFGLLLVYTALGDTARPYVRSHATCSDSTDVSLQWYRNKEYLFGGRYTDLNDFIRNVWEANYVTNWDANDMLTLLRTWQTGDISHVSSIGAGLRGDLAGALKTIQAKGLVMPCKTDLYFPVRVLRLSSERVTELSTNTTLSPKTVKQRSRRWEATSPSYWLYHLSGATSVRLTIAQLCVRILNNSLRNIAGGSINPADVEFVSKHVAEFLQS